MKLNPIEECAECSHCWAGMPMLHCDHPNGKDLVLPDEGFPEWCPLEDKKDEI